MTTLIREYNRIKKSYPNHLLFYRLGKFYELFLQDAVTASKTLNIVLNKRKISGNYIQSCGIPEQSLEIYSNKLLNAGFKIAIAEQFFNNSSHKPKFIRKVSKILTPGTIIDEEHNDNALLAINSREIENKLDLCWGNITFGKFYIDTISPEELQSHLSFIKAKEVIIKKVDRNKFKKLIPNEFCNNISFYQSEQTQHIFDNQIIRILFKNNNSALQIIINYVSQIHPKCNIKAWEINNYNDDQYLIINRKTVENLELIKERKSSLISNIDKTKTAMGKRLLKQSILKPLNNIGKINQRLHSVKLLINENNLKQKIISSLKYFPDLEKIIGKIAITSKASARDLLLIKEALEIVANISQTLFFYNNNNKLNDKLSNISKKLICDFHLIYQLNFALFQTDHN